MAIKWISYFLDESELEDSELLLAIVIADHSDNDGKSYPGVETLARRLRKSVRQTQTLLQRLMAKGYVTREGGIGRGHKTTFQLQKVKPTAPFKPIKSDVKGEADRTLSEPERVKSSVIKGEVQRQERVKFSVLQYKEETYLNVKKNPVCFSHPALAAIRRVTKSSPPNVLWQRLCDRLGTEVDENRLKACFVEWVSRGFKEKNYGWAEDWYVNGIPGRENGRASPAAREEKLPSIEEVEARRKANMTLKPVPKSI
jgi:hypothetical protein